MDNKPFETKCIHCRKVFELNDNDKWLVKRAKENNLKEALITCTQCGKRFTIDPFALPYIPLSSNLNDTFSSHLKYRSEQLTITKINGIIENHAETKSEYYIKRYYKEKEYHTEVELTDRIITIYPERLQEAMNLVNEVDTLKNNVSVTVNKDIGKIDKITNIGEIQKQWLNLKKQIEARYSFLQSNETRKNLETFLSQSEMQMTEENILLYFTSQPFFDLYFDKYLVDYNGISLASDTKTYYSQLFDQLPITMNVTPEILFETPDTIICMRNIDKLDNPYNSARIEEIYNQRYKPQIGYKFSEYVYNHRTEYTINQKENLLEQATMNITEAVKNNIEVIVDYKLRRIES